MYIHIFTFSDLHSATRQPLKHFCFHLSPKPPLWIYGGMKALDKESLMWNAKCEKLR